MRLIIVISILLVKITCFGQVVTYNQFPSIQPQHVLDDKLTNISFAFSMRVLESDYNGPLVKLRRSSDNAEMDFYWADNDIVDIEAINLWAGTDILYLTTWYDQSGLGRNAVQTNSNQQPVFYPDNTIPYFVGDGLDDHIEIPVSIQLLTNNGANGTVLLVSKASTKSQHSFGVLVGSNRWSTHLNWSNNNLYFDPGICCNNPRYISNASNVGLWKQYSFIRTDNSVIIRLGGLEKLNGNHTTGACTINNNFTIGWANGDQANNHSTSSFNEFIMYNTNISNAIYEEIEQNSITFWNI